MMMTLTKFLLCLALAAVAAHPAAAANSSLACGELSKRFPNNVAYSPDLPHANPSDLNFTYTVTHYSNAALSLEVPSCVFFPTGASDVSFAVQVLLKYPDVPWAAKSGGHNANKGYSSAKGGVLISFRPYMQTTTFNSVDGTASIGPGSRWEEVLSALEPYGKGLEAGSIGDVGVGGYLLGGGSSFLNSQYGMACDLVVEYQVVLADGTIAVVNKTQNADLFFALKGGGNQFAIITSFKMKPFTIGQIWGGIKTYTFDKRSAIIDATQDFAANNPNTKAAIITTFLTRTANLTNAFYVFHFYDGPSPPAGVFDKFDAIRPLIDRTKVQSYGDMLKENDVGDSYGYNLNYLLRGQTLPCLAGDQGRDVLQHQLSSFLSIANANQTAQDVIYYTFSIAPRPVAVSASSLRSGSNNTFAFDIADGDRLWMDYTVFWLDPADEARAFSKANLFTQSIAQYTRATYPNAVSTHQTNGADQYTPLFMNDGMFDQATSLFYKPDVYQRLKGIQQARDPRGFFSKRSGGYKFL